MENMGSVQNCPKDRAFWVMHFGSGSPFCHFEIPPNGSDLLSLQCVGLGPFSQRFRSPAQRGNVAVQQWAQAGQ